MSTRTSFELGMSKFEEKYKELTKKSYKMDSNAQEYLPGGDTRTAIYFDPYPIYAQKGKGCNLYDVDGNNYIDFLNNYTALIHGHAHPAITKAVTEQLKKGSSFAAPTKSQYFLAELICERVKSVEQIRFCNSGTEATMNAIRTARFFTGRSKIVKMEGGYHGTHDLAEVSINPKLENAGPVHRPKAVPTNQGIPQSVLEEVIVVPFNNMEVTKSIVSEHKDKIACVIVEPMLGAAGTIAQENGYLEFLRDLTKRLNILLIFDEIVTFRLGFGGAQTMYGIKPDLTTFGKIIGGGFPVGAFGGSRDIMKVFSPREKTFISQSGTFNANPITMEAGIACLNLLTLEMIEHINSLGDLLRAGIESAFQKSKIMGMASGIGSLAQPHINPDKVIDYRSASKGCFEAMALIHLALLNKGIYIPRRGGEMSITTTMTEAEIKTFLNAFEESLNEIKPFIAEIRPELIM
jgi:glutamate-1-semialdehyde 2,1-aminomutase